jgi:hypothetical protein
MNLITFTLVDFLDLMVKYNTTFWPMQLIAYGLGVIAVILVVWKTGWSSRITAGVLALFWLWVGAVFNAFYFTRLMPLAIVFALLFVIQGILFAISALRQNLTFRFRPNVYGIVGGLMIFYAMVAYPAIEYLLGRGYPQLLPFGLVPCPTAIFTLGMLLWSEKKLPWTLWVIPVLYALSGLVPVSIGIVEDIGLIASGLVAALMLLSHRDK